jgi:hypothetical protein
MPHEQCGREGGRASGLIQRARLAERLLAATADLDRAAALVRAHQMGLRSAYNQRYRHATRRAA